MNEFGRQGNLVVFRAIVKGEPDGLRFWFWCPGCEEAHQYSTGKGDGPRWGFNDDYERPTFTPSLRVRSTHGEARTPRVCHLFMTDGKIRFLGDCTHDLKGQTVDIPAPPEWML